MDYSFYKSFLETKRRKCSSSYKQFLQECIDHTALNNLISCIDLVRLSTHDFNFSDKKIMVMRHDVDHDPETAREMAKVEKQLGVTSTFFILTQDKETASHFMWDKDKNYFIDLFLEIQEMGHEIGLHYDFLGDFFSLGKHPHSNLKEILNTLREAGLLIQGCASHGSGVMRELLKHPKKYPLNFVNYKIWEELRDDKETLTLNFKNLEVPCVSLKEFSLVYEAYSLKKDYYFSDSGATFWRNLAATKTLPSHLKDMDNGKIIQLLTHPIWWRNNVN
jgi:hypothetical protein